MIFLDSIFRILWRDDSGALQGSLCNLRDCIERDNMKNKKKRDNKHWNEEDRFFNTILSCFVTSHALDFFGMHDETSTPSKNVPTAAGRQIRTSIVQSGLLYNALVRGDLLHPRRQ